MPRENADHRRTFEIWYANDLNVKKTAEAVGTSPEMVYRWIGKYGWRQRAAARDAVVEAESVKVRVRRKMAIEEKQRKAGEALRLRGQEFLTSTKITRAVDAIRAIQVGVALERQAEGLPEWYAQLQTLSEDELEEQYERTLRLARLEAEGDRAGTEPESEEAADDPEELDLTDEG